MLQVLIVFILFVMHSDPDHSFCRMVVLILHSALGHRKCQNKIKNSKKKSLKNGDPGSRCGNVNCITLKHHMTGLIF